MKKIIFLLILLFSLLLIATLAVAWTACCSAGVECTSTDSCRAYTSNSVLVQYKCRRIVNSGSNDVFIPHKTNLEFAYFRNAVEGYLSSTLSISSCGSTS
ncbi:MAG: hypothetical protein MAG795_00075 [Candidatus Woesearchaeota archaeon]|nr:hypothetical protein [Candidatus Woesearchaeota archaeon]